MLSRREFLVTCIAAASQIGAEADMRKCRPVISGPLWWYDPALSREWGVSGWRDELDRQSAIGFNLLWLCNTSPALASEDDITALRSVMDLCAKRKLRVILDTGASPSWWVKHELKKELDFCGANIKRLGEEFGGHPAFFAWYVPHEIYWMQGELAAYMEELYPTLVERCRKAAAKPVTLSPFFLLDRDKVFGDFHYTGPDEYEGYWTRLIKRSGFDIIMLQDSGEHFSYVTNEMRRPYFQAMSRACKTAGARFWGNVETGEFECPSKEEYIRRYGRVNFATVPNPPWRAVPMDHLREKLDLASEFSEEIVTWGYREYCRPPLGDAARQWYADYRAYTRQL